MKNLVQYINEHQEQISKYCEMLDQINLEIITESFKCNIFRDFVKQQTKLYDKWKDDKAASVFGSYNKPLNISRIFKNNYIYWDKITDNDIQTFDANDSEGLKLYKRICSNRTNSLHGIIIFERIKDDDVYNIPKYCGIIIKTYSDINYYSSTQDGLLASLKPSEAIEYLNPDIKYHIIILDESNSTTSLRKDRNDAKYGMIIPGNTAQLQRLAEQNRERYRKLAAKLKVERQAASNDLPKKVNEVVNKVMDLAVNFSKNPAKYAKYEYDIKKLMDLVGDREVSYSDRGKYHKYGINGLMYYFSLYIETMLSMGKGTSYEYEQKSNEQAKNKLIELINKINNSYVEIMTKVKETENVESQAND